jgi:MFS family permease
LFLGYSLLAGWLTVRHMHRAAHPLIDFACLRMRTFAVSMWGGSLFRIAIMASPFLLPLLFQVAFGMSAFQSGLLVLTMFAGNLLMKPATTPLLRAFGFRTMLIANGLLSGLLIAGCGFLVPHTPRIAIIAVLFLHGLSRSMQFTSLNTLMFVDIPKPLMSSATSFSAVVQQMGMGMGVAVAAVMLRAAAWMRGEHGGLPSLMDFHIAFWLVGIMGMLAVADCFGLEQNAGAEVTGHRVAS